MSKLTEVVGVVAVTVLYSSPEIRTVPVSAAPVST
jgi:hypothetical protein